MFEIQNSRERFEMKITEGRIIGTVVVLLLIGFWWNGYRTKKASLGYPAFIDNLENKEIYRVVGIVRLEEGVITVLQVGDKTNNIRFFKLGDPENFLKTGHLYQWNGSTMKMLSTEIVVTNYIPVNTQPELGLPTKGK